MLAMKTKLHPELKLLVRAVKKGDVQALLQMGDWWEENNYQKEMHFYRKLLRGLRYCVSDQWRHRITRSEGAKRYLVDFRWKLNMLGYNIHPMPSNIVLHSKRVAIIASRREWVADMACKMLAYMRAQQPKIEEPNHVD